jgi:predicted dienelactone hydrolase
MTPRRTLRVLAAATAVALSLLGSVTPAQADETTDRIVQSYTTTVGTDAATVYYPTTYTSRDLPVVLFLQGAAVDRGFYSEYAKAVARRGFAVVVPDHVRTVFGPPSHYSETAQINAAVAWAAAEDTNTSSPVVSRLDEATLLLAGHSFGGAAALYGASGLCQVPFCFGPPAYPLPTQVKAAALVGTNSILPGPPGTPPVATPLDLQVPTALLNGATDSVSTPAEAQATFNALSGAERALISHSGLNHYGVTDIDSPPPAAPDPSPQTRSRAEGIDELALWTDMWFKAQLGNRVAQLWMNGLGDAIDADVTVQLAG